MTTPQYTLVIPLKPPATAKSRLAPAVGALRPELALAFALDTVDAALRSACVAGVVAVCDDPAAGAELALAGAVVIPDAPAAGLNAALNHGAEYARSALGAGAVAAMSADLPALLPAELTRVLTAAHPFPRAFLADTQGVGTVLLAAGAGVRLAPAFGGESRARHAASGAVELTPLDAATVRRDVDTGADLAVALALGVGPRTLATLGRMQATAYTYSPDSRSGQVLLDDGTALKFDAAAFDAGGLRLLRPGQRVRIETEGEGGERRITLITLQTF
ncbi:2-phospho-L-lactate guanylyltransferase [Streptacidiphilus fuscans]|uniref:Phosphoenolpyruvate guanylyltransferase n=1 Tax=Streptacidiphilus fuscans TaxID=2789292 RepID=A0A931FDA3_9ACTN|nr:2-phospho-L-lactate guanylyltransferase [Streptacidiphilus fuscans]MBF9067341.1 2-phospho-L-lactate guanylyltransferase [Streptacidiphilus fuscans]